MKDNIFIITASWQISKLKHLTPELRFFTFGVKIKIESVEKLFLERNFQVSSEKNEEEEGILGSKSAAD